MRIKHLALVALAVASALMAAGCGRKVDPNSIRFRYWGDAQEVGIIEGMTKEFEAANPGVKVVPERKNADDTYADVLLQEFAANSAPDVMFASTDNIERLEPSGKLADLNTFLAKESDLKATDYYDVMINRFTKQGKLLVLPRDIAPVVVVFYNKDLFDKGKVPYPKDGWDWDDLRDKAKKLTVRPKLGPAEQYGYGDDWNIIDTWVLAGGGRFVDDYYNPTRFTFGEPASVEAIRTRWKTFHEDMSSPFVADNQALNGGNTALFLNGKLAMFHSGIWKTPLFREIKNFKWDMVLFPLKKGAKDAVYVTGGSGYAMRSDTANPDLAWKFIKFLAGPEGQKRLASTGLAQPALKAMAKGPEFLDGKDPKNKKMLLYAAEHGLSSPAWEPWREFWRAIWMQGADPMWLKGYKGDIEADLKAMQAKANEKFFKKK